jgi:hypothetical protein
LKKKKHELHMVDAVGNDCDQVLWDREVGKVTLHIVNALLDILSFCPGFECKREVTKTVLSHPRLNERLPSYVSLVKRAKASTE